MLVGYFDVALADQDLRLGAPVVHALPEGNFEVQFYRPDRFLAGWAFLFLVAYCCDQE